MNKIVKLTKLNGGEKITTREIVILTVSKFSS